MPLISYKNDGVIAIQIRDRLLDAPENFLRDVPIHVPRFCRSLDAAERANLERGYAIAVTHCLRTLLYGLGASAYARVNPLQHPDITSTYRNPEWEGWEWIDRWSPRAGGATFKSFFGRGFDTFSTAQRTGTGRTIAATAAGLASALSSLAIPDIRTSYGRCVSAVDRKQLASLSKDEVISCLQVDRHRHHRIHISRELLGDAHGPFSVAKILIHEASHAYAACSDFYYLNDELLTATSTPGKEIAQGYLRARPGANLPDTEKREFSATGRVKDLYLMQNADTIAFFIIHFGREGSRGAIPPR